MPHPIFRSTSTALITGAASGIGLALAQLCAKHGMKLALVDIHNENLATVVSLLGDVEVETYAADVSKIEDWTELKAKVEQRFGAVNLLMLNAGIAAKGDRETVEVFHKVRFGLLR